MVSAGACAAAAAMAEAALTGMVTSGRGLPEEASGKVTEEKASLAPSVATKVAPSGEGSSLTPARAGLPSGLSAAWRTVAMASATLLAGRRRDGDSGGWSWGRSEGLKPWTVQEASWQEMVACHRPCSPEISAAGPSRSCAIWSTCFAGRATDPGSWTEAGTETVIWKSAPTPVTLTWPSEQETTTARPISVVPAALAAAVRALASLAGSQDSFKASLLPGDL
jgi:hypothetical protein